MKELVRSPRTMVVPLRKAACVILAVLGVPALPGGVGAQVPDYEVGASHVSGTDIQPYANEWLTTSHLPDGTVSPTGRWTDSVEVVRRNGRELLRRTQKTFDVNDSLVTTQTHLVDRHSMAPILNHLVSGDRLVHLDFGDLHASGFLLMASDQPAIPMDAEIPATAFDWDIGGLLLLAFDMKEGDEVRFPYLNFIPTEMGEGGMPTQMGAAVQWLTATAQKSERIEAGSLGYIAAVPVQVVQGARTFTFWLLENAPYIAKLVVESPRGTTVWQMR